MKRAEVRYFDSIAEQEVNLTCDENQYIYAIKKQPYLVNNFIKKK